MENFNHWQIIKTDKEVKVRPLNLYESRHFKEFDGVGGFVDGELLTMSGFMKKKDDFETFANSHTFILANPKDLPENVTEVSREDVSEPRQQHKFVRSNGESVWLWSVPNTIDYSKFETRQVAYYSPKQAREEEKIIFSENCNCQSGDECDGEYVINYLKREQAKRDWQEDFEHENGNYQCICMYCKCVFVGHKRRTVCKECDTKQQEKPKQEESLEQLEEQYRTLIFQIKSLEQTLKKVKTKIYWIMNPHGDF